MVVVYWCYGGLHPYGLPVWIYYRKHSLHRSSYFNDHGLSEVEARNINWCLGWAEYFVFCQDISCHASNRVAKRNMIHVATGLQSESLVESANNIYPYFAKNVKRLGMLFHTRTEVGAVQEASISYVVIYIK